MANSNQGHILAVLIMAVGALRSRPVVEDQSKHLLSFYFIGLFLSAVMAWYFRGQNLLTSVLALKAYYSWVLYFTLHGLRVNERFLSGLILSCAIVYVVCYQINLVTYPDIWFGQKVTDARGSLRITFLGEAFMLYSIFLLVRKLLVSFNWLHLILIFAFMATLFLRAGRSSIFSVFLVIVWLAVWKSRITRLQLVMVTFLILGAGASFFVYGGIWDGLISASIRDADLGADYIRLLSANYYLFDHPEHWLNWLFGNGFHSGRSEYGQMVMGKLWGLRGFYAEDIGLLGFWSYFGLFTLVPYLLIVRKMFDKGAGLDINGYAFFLCLMAVTTNASYTFDSLLLQPILLYLLDLRSSHGG
ncbi:MAG: hypothetical protein ACPG6J_01390 [Flavobacteriaceae bacterium]